MIALSRSAHVSVSSTAALPSIQAGRRSTTSPRARVAGARLPGFPAARRVPVHDLAYDAVDRSVVLHHVTQAQGVVVNAQVVGTRDRTRRLPANSMGGSALGAPATRGPGPAVVGLVRRSQVQTSRALSVQIRTFAEGVASARWPATRRGRRNVLGGI